MKLKIKSNIIIIEGACSPPFLIKLNIYLMKIKIILKLALKSFNLIIFKIETNFD